MSEPSSIPQDADPRFEETLFSKFGTLSGRYLKFIGSLHLRRYGLNIAAYRVLTNIARLAPLGSSELGRHTSLEPDKITRAVDMLVERGFVDRSTDSGDRRRIVLRLTPQGARDFRKISAVGAQFEAKLLSSLTDEEVDFLREIVDRLVAKAVSEVTDEAASAAPSRRVKREDTIP